MSVFTVSFPHSVKENILRYSMKRVMILGSPGAGKSTLSFALSEKTGIPVTHLDKLFWTPGWVSVSAEELDKKIESAVSEDKWIIDGNYSRTIPLRLERCDTVIFLDYPTHVCLFGVIKRILTNHGKVREDMSPGCPERFDLEFLKYVVGFRKNQRAKILSLLSSDSAAGKSVYTLKNRAECRRFLSELS